jgi:uncharacterized protein (TIGR03437 family)
MRIFLAVFLAAYLHGATIVRPTLQWYQPVSGSGASAAVSVASDANGNLYIAGNTTSLDLPTVSAAQKSPGGSPVIKIDTGSGTALKLYSQGLAAVASLAVDPENTQTLYAASGNTLSRSTDAGTTWTPLPGFPSVAAINSIAVDPSNSNTLYATASSLGALKSTDAGTTWTAINQGIPLTSGQGTSIYGKVATVTALNLYQIWVDPKSPASLFAQADTTLLRSTNAGATWSVSLNGPQYNFLAFDPFTPGTLYTRNYKSVDEGVTWTPSLMPNAAVVPDPFHQGRLYSAGYLNGVTALFVSVDGSVSWNPIIQGQVAAVAADPANPVLYAYVPQMGIIRSSDGFSTYSKLADAPVSPQQLLIAGKNLFLLSQPATDVFVTKLDPSGKVIYSTYFGGSAADTAVGMAAGSDGSVYVAGQTLSSDFPVTKSAYGASLSGARSNFVFKLNPDGSLGWSTYFADSSSTVNAIAIDSAGDAYVAGVTSGNLPTTPGAYQTQLTTSSSCGAVTVGFCLPVSEAFLTKFNPQGAALLFSTYIADHLYNNLLQGYSNVLAVNTAGAYLAGGNTLALMNTSGSQMLAHTALPVQSTIAAMSVDMAGNLFVTGWTSSATFPASAGAFQTSLAGGDDVFVAKFDSALSQVVAATLLGGESEDLPKNVTVDPASGAVIVSGYTDSLAFPTRTPFQESFAPRSGFVAGLDPSLSQLLFSTYVGDVNSFSVAGAVPDGSGGVLLAGATLNQTNGYEAGDPGFAYSTGAHVIANRIALPPAATVRLDSVVNFASGIGLALAPGETIAINGSGFAADSQLSLDGAALPLVSMSANRLVAMMPAGLATSGTREITVSSGGVQSNSVLLPSGPASPGVYSVDGSGLGQAYGLNADGTVNSPANPTTPGAAITLFVNGVGQINNVSGYAVTALTPAVFIDGFYANGIAATVQQIKGLPGGVYAISVYVPTVTSLIAQNPDLKNFVFPPQSPIDIFIGGTVSQGGVFISIANVRPGT